MGNILVTGYSGFVGSYLLSVLGSLENVNLLGRSEPPECKEYLKANIDPHSDYSLVLQGVDVIVHIAARVHVMKDKAQNPSEEFRYVNVAGTLNLARQAVASGAKRFVFISSIKSNGESSKVGCPFRYDDPRNAVDLYGKSKSEAEEQLLQLAKETGLEVVIIRPTLVYGSGVKANFASLMKLAAKGVPLPFGCIRNNSRSLVSVANLVDLIITCIDHPKAVNQVFLVSDDHDVSTSEIARQMAISLDKPIWQLPVPVWCYHLAGKLFGKSDVVNRLTGSLQVDITHTKETLDWTPPQSLEEGFREAAQALLNNRK